MADESLPRDEWIHQQVQRFGMPLLPAKPVVLDDTTDFMAIDRDHIIDLQGILYLVRCNEREGRFGMEDQPKFWVKRTVDFDLNQDVSDFDVWSVGNILHCVVAKGFVTFSDCLRSWPELSGQLKEDDASVFFPHRVMNLRRVYPYLPAKLNDVLLRFSFGARACYDRVSQIIADLSDCAESMNWKWSGI